MGRLNPFNREELITSDLEFIQDTKTDEIRNRFKDQLLTAGILPPTNATLVELADGCTGTVFPISIAANVLRVGDAGAIPANSIHVAYDTNGDRIAFPDGDVTPFNQDAYEFTTAGISGTNTPFSTGRLNIDPRAPIVVGATGTRYVFVSYVSVVKTLSTLAASPLPPNHNTLQPIIIVTPAVGTAGDTQRAIGNLDQKSGFAYAHQHIDGYRIFVATGPDDPTYSATPEVTIAGPTVTLNATNIVANGYVTSFINPDRAIYLGKFIAAYGGALSGLDCSGRQLISVRPTLAKGTVGGGVGAYSAGLLKTFAEHIAAVGDGVVGVKNPHGEDIQNVTHGLANVLQEDALDNGIIDEAASTNNPPSTDINLAVENILLPSIVGSVDFADIVASTDVLKTYVNPTFSANVYLSQGTGGELLAGREIYLEGEKLYQVRPLKPGATDAYVGFTATDAAGTYIIFGRTLDATNNPGQMLLGKVPDTVTLLATDLEFGRIYWNGRNTLSKDIASLTDSTIQDRRNFGLISKQQISTRGLKDPDVGMLAVQSFENKVANSNFVTPNAIGTPLVPCSWNTTGSIGTVPTIATITKTTVSDIESAGPKTTYGLNVSPVTAITASSDFVVRSPMTKLKPNTLYTASAFLKLKSTTNRMTISGKFVDNAGTTDRVLAPIDFTVNRSITGWQRIVVTLQTTAFGDFSGDSDCFAFKCGKIAEALHVGDQGFYLASVCVVEGEWTIGYAGPAVHSGEIFMWDQSSSCPPGSEEVPALSGRMPIGKVGTTLPIGATTAAQTTVKSGAIGNHLHMGLVSGYGSNYHSIYGSFFQTQWIQGKDGYLNTTDWAGNTDIGLGQYGLLFCRRL